MKYKSFLIYSFLSLVIILSILLSYFSLNWSKISIFQGIIFIILQTLCQFNSSEVLFKIIIYLRYPIVKKEISLVGKNSDQKLLINYNLKSFDKDSIEECFDNFYQTFLHNLSTNYFGVLISVTEDPLLIDYEIRYHKKLKKKLYQDLLNKAKKFLKNHYTYSVKQSDNTINNESIILNIDTYENLFWEQFELSHLKINYHQICQQKSNNFIYLRRTTKTLKKCGQYQDLILLSEGYSKSYTYIDQKIYGKLSRAENQNLFYESPYLEQILGQKFKFTLVLDSDCRINPGEVYKLISLAETYPQYDIFQPEIKIYSNKKENIFQKIQKITQFHSNIINSSLSLFFNHSAFYGKGLINNHNYFNKIIGPPENLIEYIPIDAISHDTFESMILPTLYTNQVTIWEQFPDNLISFNIRELRWNYGDFIVFKHIYPWIFGRCKSLYSRNRFKLNFTQSYYAILPIRNLLSKLFLLTLIIYSYFMYFTYPYLLLLFSYTVVTVIILPLFMILKNGTFFEGVLILMNMILHYTPDIFLATVRIFQLLFKNLTNNSSWTPQHQIDCLIKKKGIVRCSFQYFGIYSLLSITGLYFTNYLYPFFSFFLLTICVFPFYVILVNLDFNICQNKIRFRKR